MMRSGTVRCSGSARRLLGVLTLGVGAASCQPYPGGGTIALGRPRSSGACEEVAAPRVAAASLWVAVTDSMSPEDAPLPRTNAERVLFPLLYAPAAPATCHGDGATVVERNEAAARAPMRSAPSLDPRAGPPVAWPAATGGYGVAAAVDTALDLAPRGSAGPRMHVSRIAPDAGRDALDAGVDVLITSDPTAIAYADARADFVAVPLPWDHVYVLIRPDAPASIDRDTVRALDGDLAGDAVRVEAQAADDPQWGDALAACDTALPVHPTGPASPVVAPQANRIVYAAGDDVARALSERLVALANVRDSRLAALAPTVSAAAPVHAVGLDATQIRVALTTGRDAAYVVAMDVHGVCQDVATLAGTARWVAPDPEQLRARVTPLIVTRARAIVRRGRVGVAIDGADNVYLEFGPSAGS